MFKTYIYLINCILTDIDNAFLFIYFSLNGSLNGHDSSIFIDSCEEAKGTNIDAHLWSIQLTLDLNSSQQHSKGKHLHIYALFSSPEQPAYGKLYLFIHSCKALHYACMNDLFTCRVLGGLILLYHNLATNQSYKTLTGSLNAKLFFEPAVCCTASY